MLILLPLATGVEGISSALSDKSANISTGSVRRLGLDFWLVLIQKMLCMLSRAMVDEQNQSESASAAHVWLVYAERATVIA